MTTPQPQPLFLKVAEAAKLVQVSPRFLYQALAGKDGPRVVRLGRAIRIKLSDLLQWADGSPKPVFHRTKSKKDRDDAPALNRSR